MIWRAIWSETIFYVYIYIERERNHKQYTKIEKTPIFGYIKILVIISIYISVCEYASVQCAINKKRNNIYIYIPVAPIGTQKCVPLFSARLKEICSCRVLKQKYVRRIVAPDVVPSESHTFQPHNEHFCYYRCKCSVCIVHHFEHPHSTGAKTWDLGVVSCVSTHRQPEPWTGLQWHWYETGISSSKPNPDHSHKRFCFCLEDSQK